MNAVDAQSTKCCFSLGYNATQSPHLYRVDVNASHVDSRKRDNAYVVMISFPPEYVVQDNPSSPYSYVSCLRKDDGNFTYRCDSKDKLTFYVEMTMLIPQIPENNTLSATVNIYGDQCNQQDVCPDLAALAASINNDKVSLGPFGSWSKIGVVIFGSTYQHEVYDDPNQDPPVNDDNSKSISEKNSNDELNNVKRSELQRTKSSRKKQSEFNV
ncbi:23715_t:CDS:2 [Dentiscutata erythropus]|uniref:23715_t:CDS:1 n=1 Tax=Dentiscutata erythropus TaxID=1348616 RepID=A0A9N9G7F3_9GLOM|nr:23715_t:CDS:2 [Dentiscutata erythropus]